MFITDRSGAQWTIDESLKTLAVTICRNEDNVGHIDVDQIVFVRIVGSNATWMGKIWAIKTPYNLLMRYAAYKFGKMGMLDLSRLKDVQDGLLDPKFVIALNHDLIMTKKEQSKVEYLTLLHEMLHVDSTMTSLVKHDIEDFATLVNDFGPYWTEGVFAKDVPIDDGEADE